VAHWKRLSALDASFLGIETERAPMHVGALVILDAGPLARPDGGIEFARIRRYFESALDKLPRYRQRVEWVPGIRHPVWVDDEHFNIHYHLRHTALPRPGDDRLLKRLAGRIFSQRLDRTRPLWEMWVVEGLTDNRFALISKIHHCMIDGVAGVDLMAALMRGTTDDTIPDAEPWEPRPRPSRSQLLASEIEHRAVGSRNVLDRIRGAVRDPRSWWEDARGTAEGLATSLWAGLAPASPTPLNPHSIGTYRRFDTCKLDLEACKAIKNQLGGKLNDVVLTIASGALATFLERRGERRETIADFRALIPVNIRRDADHGAGGNKVAMMLAELPIAERDPERRLARVTEITGYLKTQSHQVESSELIEELSNLTATSLVKEVFRLAGRQRAYNVVITNVPGPPFPMYLLGARIQEIYPLVPLFGNQAVGIALFSYCGQLFWGLVGDWQETPDLHEFVGDLEAAFGELCAAAKVSAGAPRDTASAP
jgi:WS/DGAT/MGAT family acyltransferase